MKLLFLAAIIASSALQALVLEPVDSRLNYQDLVFSRDTNVWLDVDWILAHYRG